MSPRVCARTPHTPRGCHEGTTGHGGVRVLTACPACPDDLWTSAERAIRLAGLARRPATPGSLIGTDGRGRRGAEFLIVKYPFVLRYEVPRPGLAGRNVPVLH